MQKKEHGINKADIIKVEALKITRNVFGQIVSLTDEDVPGLMDNDPILIGWINFIKDIFVYQDRNYHLVKVTGDKLWFWRAELGRKSGEWAATKPAEYRERVTKWVDELKAKSPQIFLE